MTEEKFICKTCRNRMEVKEIMNNATNEFKRCLHDPEINCDAVVECNRHEGVKVE